MRALPGPVRAAFALALAGATALGSVSCTRVSTGGAAAAHEPTLQIAMSYAINTLDPLLMTQESEANIAALVFDPLIATDDHGKDVPILASVVPSLANGGISKDGLTITYHLRTNVKWQDGVPFTSRDVAFSIAAIDNPKTLISSRHGYDDIASVSTPDAATVAIHLKKRFAPAVDTFFATSDSPYFIVPAHVLEKEPDINRVAFNSMPLGTGPFKVKRWLRGDRVELEANDAYFLGKPGLRKIVIHYIPDENVIINQLKTHDIDFFQFATPKAYEQLKNLPGIDNHVVADNAYDSIMFNTVKPPFHDARVRRAVGLALDKAKLVEAETYGSAVPAREDMPPSVWAYDATAGTAARDLAEAGRLLDAAGWKTGPSGVRAKGGEPLAFQIAYRTESVTDRGRGVLVAQMLRDAGMDVSLKGYNSSLFYGSAAGGGILSNGKYQASFQTWYSGVDPDDSTQLLCDQVAPAGYDWARYCNPAMDAAQHAALSNYDRPTRKAAYAKIERLLAEDAPMVYLWWPRQVESITPALKNFRPNGIIDTWNAYAWTF